MQKDSSKNTPIKSESHGLNVGADTRTAPVGSNSNNDKKLRKNFVSNKKNHTFAIAIADMAQLVEQRIRNAWVPGSSPGIGSVRD